MLQITSLLLRVQPIFPIWTSLGYAPSSNNAPMLTKWLATFQLARRFSVQNGVRRAFPKLGDLVCCQKDALSIAVAENRFIFGQNEASRSDRRAAGCIARLFWAPPHRMPPEAPWLYLFIPAAGFDFRVTPAERFI
jgi:hypothetical protein